MQLSFTFYRSWQRAEIMAALEPPPHVNVLPRLAASCEPTPHPLLPYLDGSGFEVGSHLGSGIDKSAYELLDETGEPRRDVVLKVARHSYHCDENNQCLNEIQMWEWLLEVDHPLKGLFAAVEAIVTNCTVEEGGERAVRTCYLSEYAEKNGWGESTEMYRVKQKLSAYFGIYDLHANNVGTTADGRSVVLDYGLFAGFERVQENWAAAAASLGPDATPQQIFEAVEPVNELSDECDGADDWPERMWCSSCETYVDAEEHCRCTICRRERRGGYTCQHCDTTTNQPDPWTTTLGSHVRLCATCLTLARANRAEEEGTTTTTTPPDSTPGGSGGVSDCNCDWCRKQRADAAKRAEIRQRVDRHAAGFSFNIELK
jgi:hypothetical protein